MCTLQRGLVFVIALLFVAPATSSAQLPASELEGTWKLASQTLVYPDTVINRTDEWGPTFKILNSTHFAWGRETQDGESVIAGGGRYEYYPQRDLYIEHIQYHSDTALDGASLRFTARVEGDTWYHVGEVGDFKLREVWKRVDARAIQAEMYDDTTQTRTAGAGNR